MSAFDDYLQLLNNNPKMDATKNAFNNWLDTTKNTINNSLPPTNGDPSALIDWAANSTPTGLAGNILAWHGSPHKFTKFEDKAIGTGEGRQAFGMGHYSGEAVNELDPFYRKRLVEEKKIAPIESFIEDPAHATLLDKVRKQVHDSVDFSNYVGSLGPSEQKVAKLVAYNNTLKDIWNTAQRFKDFGTEFTPKFSDVGNELYYAAKNYVPPHPRQGYLYQLNLKPDKKDLLNFETGIRDHLPKVVDSYTSLMDSLGLSKDAANAVKSNLKGANVYQNISNAVGGYAEASKLLDRFGVPGHSFAGQGGKGLDNYVMYNPDNIEIVRRIYAGLENPRNSFKYYPKKVHELVNTHKTDPGNIQPKTVDSTLRGLQESWLKNFIPW
jgi:hypothetical protein